LTNLLYSAVLYLLLPVVLLRLGLRGLRNPAYWRRWSERFGYAPVMQQSGCIWLHAVSVGETRAAVPLVRALMQRYPQRPILITTMTPTGSAQVRALFGEQVAHCYVPYDLPGVVRRFLGRVRPSLAIIMETELWPNLFRHCRLRAIPLLVANVRMSEKSMLRYVKFPVLTRATLEQVSLLAVQSETDAARLRTLGAPQERVRVTGSIKFEIDLPPGLPAAAAELRKRFGGDRPVWLAASTRDGEEQAVLAAYRGLKARFPGLLLVLVPRHPERFAGVARLCRSEGFTIALRSAQPPTLDPATDILVGDSMGELPLFYAAADVAFVGGSLVNTGGHNVLEASAAGVPVVFGPHMFNFADISRLTLERGAGRQVADVAGLTAALAEYLADPAQRQAAGEAGRRMVEENRGALAATLGWVQTLLAKVATTRS
jgi:3-deoxy-D-manno-octulosonic-acid transferase